MIGPRRRVLGYLLAAAVLLGGWQVLALSVTSGVLPTPSSAFVAFFRLAPDLVPHALVSLWRVLASIAIGTLVAVPLGLAIGRSATADALLAPLLFLTYPVPKVVFLPVLLVLFGLGDASKIVLITLIVFFQVLLTARDAARTVPEGAIVSVRSLGATKLDIARHVIVPATLPDVFTALRIGLGTAIAVLFVAESIAGTDGLGWFIMDSWGRIDHPRMFAGIIAMGLVGVALYEALEALERWATRWRRAAG